MVIFRLLRLIVHLLAGVATCALLFPVLDNERRLVRIRRWSNELLSLCGVTVEVICVGSTQPTMRALTVANHISWLDIFVINSLHPCRFVAKADIRDWPLIGWLCAKAGTIFISRGRLRDVRHIYQGLVANLHAGDQVAFFPEGTTSAQGSLLPFHANLFEAAIEAKVPVQPYALRYVDADDRPHEAVNFIGETTLVDSVFAILRVGKIRAQLFLLSPISSDGIPDRRELAAQAHAEIAAALNAGA